MRGEPQIEMSAPLANLFARAEEGIERRDWKFAIDSLQRIIDHPENSLVVRDESGGCVLYESTRRKAMRRIASLPPEGLRAYRLLFDGKAKRLLDLARETLDPAPLKRLVGRLLPTSHGDDAADLLASWALDEGRPAECIRLLNDLREIVPDYDVPAELIAAKLAVANALLGRKGEADAVIRDFKESFEQAGRAKSPADRASGPGDGTAPTGIPNWLPAAVATAYDHRAFRGRDGRAVGSWPMLGGSAARAGGMAPAVPELVDRSPWKFDMPGTAPNRWERMLADVPDGSMLLPVSRLVADDERLYVRTPLGCAALDPDNLTSIWLTSPEERDGLDGVPRSRTKRRSTHPQPPDPYLSEDYVLKAIVVSQDAVLTVLPARAPGESTIPGRFEIRPPPRQRRGDRRHSARATVLAAYDATSGVLRWQRGRSFNVDDPLGSVDFRAVPMEVGDTLWVPFLRQGDLLVGIIDPVDGALIDEVVLYATDGFAGTAEEPLTPAFADGIVLIPSDGGMLFAIDGDERRLRWANVYATTSADTRARQSSERRPDPLPSPPVAVGGLVLLVPAQREAILAFDAADGDLRWSAPVSAPAYIIGADADRVWVGGLGVSCLALGDGKELWTTSLDDIPSGRAVLSGGAVLVPTRGGLVSIEASTGNVARVESLPDSSAPLGNLLCLRSSMFSLDPSGVRRYPDLARLYPATLARYQRKPDDERISVQLAWMELLRGEPRRALDVLDAGAGERSGTARGDSSETARVRVEALLRRAKELLASGTGGRRSPEVRNLLERAVKAARSGSDRLRSGMAMADYLGKIGRNRDSYQAYLALGLSMDGDQPVRLDDDVTAVARLRIAGRIQDLRDRLGGDESAEADGHVHELVSSIVNDLHNEETAWDAARRLHGLAELPASGSGGQYGLIELAAWRSHIEQYARAEQVLRAAIRLDADPAMTAAAMMRLAEFHAAPARRQIVGAAYYLDALERRFAEMRIPGGASAPTGAVTSNGGESRQAGAEGAASASGDTQTRSVADWVAEFREAHGIPAGGGEYDGMVIDGLRKPFSERLHRLRPFTLTGEVAWSVRATTQGTPPKTFAPFDIPEEVKRSLEQRESFGPPRLVRFTGETSFALSDRVLFFGPGDVVYCQDVRNGDLLWHAVLRLPDELAESVPSSGRSPGGDIRHAVVDGQIAVLSGRDAIHALGLVSGKQLWVRPFDLSHSPGLSPAFGTAMAARDGLLVAAPHSGRLALMRMSDGSSVWERDLRGEQVAHAWITETYIITADPTFQRVHVFNRDDGGLVSQVLFRQPDSESPMPVKFVQAGGGLCGPMSTTTSDELVSVDPASGEIRWRLTLEKPLGRLFEPKEGYVGMGLLGGDVRIADARSGDVVLESRVPAANLVLDGIWSGDVLVVKHVEGGQTQPELTALDIETGDRLWYRGDLARTMGSVEMEELSGMLAAVVGEELQLDTSKPRRGKSVALIDLRTGVNVGPTVELPFGSGGARFNGDLGVYAGGIVVGTTRGIHAFSTRPKVESMGEGS